ncbi:MAG TPA: hypothetical protein VFL47_08580, partial [Flavisolibacter sp.]|nr:hypothetical protein [Flavisolibacter sp.]
MIKKEQGVKQCCGQPCQVKLRFLLKQKRVGNNPGIAHFLTSSRSLSFVKKLVRYTWAVLTKEEQKRFLRHAFFDVFISVADIFFLFVLLLLVQHYVQPGAGRSRYLPLWISSSQSLLPVAVFFLLFSAKNTAGYLVSKAHFDLNSDVAVRLSENNLVKFQQGSYEDFVRIDSSEHVRKIAFQPFEFCQQVLSGLQQLVTQICLVTITVV